MFLFPAAYILSFIYAIYLLFKKEIRGVLIFIIVGLPIYINALSVSYMYGLEKAIPLLQSFKEIAILGGFIMVIWELKKKPVLHLVDKLMIAFSICTLIYLLFPIGTYDFGSRLIGFKALSFFSLVYFTGRFCKPSSVNLNHIFSYICIVTIVAAAVLLFFEVIPYQHLHTHTGFMDFYMHFYNADPSGSYGLIWTFETESGIKRFGSIFSSPLELSSASILALSVLLAMATNKKNRLDFSNFYILSFFATFLCVVFAVSRASFANYFIVIYCFAHLTHNKALVRYYHYFVIAAIIYISFFLQGDLFNFIITTLSFQNSSSIGHLVEWLNGIQSIISHPFGLGLGASGRVSMETNDQIGGENQLIIIGVQVGVIVLIIYTWIYALLIKTGFKALKTATGKKKKLIMCVVLLKIGILIPLITSYIDTFNYITYTSYFLSGLMINMIVNNPDNPLPNAIPKENALTLSK